MPPPDVTAAPATATATATLSLQVLPAAPFTLSSMPVPAAEVDALAELRGPQATDSAVSVTAVGAQVVDVFATSDGRRAHFRLVGRPGAPSPGSVTVTFTAGAQPTAPVVATATFTVRADGTLALPTGESTSPQTFYSGPVTFPRTLVLADGPIARLVVTSVGEDLAPGDTLHTRWRTLRIYGVLAPTVHDRLQARVTAAVDGDHVHVGGTTTAGDVPWWPITYDPRDDRARLVVGRHVLRVTWSLPSMGDGGLLEAVIPVTVRDDGTVSIPIQALGTSPR